MFVLINAFLVGTASGLRALTGVVSWAAHLGYIHLDHTWLAFFGYAFTPYILTLLALGEIVNDKLPKTPSRLVPPQFITRVVTGTLCGVALGTSTGHLLPGLIAGAVGSVAGTVGGAKARGFGAKLLGRDLPAALLEDAVAIGMAISAVALLP
jgi:uncharacterized membrane protein